MGHSLSPGSSGAAGGHEVDSSQMGRRWSQLIATVHGEVEQDEKVEVGRCGETGAMEILFGVAIHRVS